eukprot:s72_g14.t1
MRARLAGFSDWGYEEQPMESYEIPRLYVGDIQGPVRLNTCRYGGLLLQFNVNLFRDPRWGRGQETPGESPELSSAFAEEYVHGIQSPIEGTSTPQAGASCKHFAAYSFEGGPTLLNRTESMRQTLPGQSNLSRHNEDAIVSRRDFAESYAKPFKACAKAKALGVMCAYNQVNGVPSCGSKRLLRGLLREKWGFDGVVVTDCDSISDMYALQGFKSTPSETVRAALAAGTNVACSPGFFRKYATPAMNPLLTQALKDALRVRFRLGEFDPPPALPTWPEVSRGHEELALEAALQSTVLLKNDGRLPLQRNLRLAVYGPLRNATEELLGNYQAWPVDVVTPLDGLKKVATVLTPGDDMELCGTAPTPSRPDADAVIIVAGLTGDDPKVQDPDLRPNNSKLCKGGCLEGEGCDRPNITLPRGQEELVRTAASWNLPVVLVLISGGALDISSVKDLPNLAGIMWMGYPGQLGGLALGQLLVGDVSPSGRLSQTFYRNEYLEHVPMNDYSFPARAGYPGRGYRFVQDEWVLYPFGFGLSYDTFSYSWEQLNHPMDVVEAEEEDEGLRGCRLQLQVTSAGKSDASVLFFLRPPSGHSGALQKRLVHFERLNAARSHSVPVIFRPRDFALYLGNDDGDSDEPRPQLVTGTWTVEVILGHCWTTFARFSGALWETFVDVATSRSPRERKGWEYRKGIEGPSEDTKDFQELQKEYEAGYGVPFLNLSARKLTAMTRDVPPPCRRDALAVFVCTSRIIQISLALQFPGSWRAGNRFVVGAIRLYSGLTCLPLLLPDELIRIMNCWRFWHLWIASLRVLALRSSYGDVQGCAYTDLSDAQVALVREVLNFEVKLARGLNKLPDSTNQTYFWRGAWLPPEALDSLRAGSTVSFPWFQSATTDEVHSYTFIHTKWQPTFCAPSCEWRGYAFPDMQKWNADESEFILLPNLRFEVVNVTKIANDPEPWSKWSG